MYLFLDIYICEEGFQCIYYMILYRNYLISQLLWIFMASFVEL